MTLEFLSFYFPVKMELSKIITDSLRSELFMKLYTKQEITGCDTKKKEILQNLEMFNKDSTYNQLALTLQTYLKSVNKTSLPMKTEFTSRLTHTLIGLTMCLIDPPRAVSHKIPSYIKSSIFWPFIKKMKTLINTSNFIPIEIRNEFDIFVNKLMVSFFTFILYTYARLSEMNINSDNLLCIFYLLGFFLNLIGEYIDFNVENVDNEFVCDIFSASLCIWPKFPSPAFNLAQLNKKKNDYLESIFHFTLMFMATQDQESYVIASEKLGELEKSYRTNYDLFADIVNYDETTFDKRIVHRANQFVISKKGGEYSLIVISDRRKPVLITSFYHTLLKIKEMEFPLKSSFDAYFQKLKFSILLLEIYIVTQTKVKEWDRLLHNVRQLLVFLFEHKILASLIKPSAHMLSLIAIYCLQMSLFNQSIDDKLRIFSIHLSFQLLTSLAMYFVRILLESEENSKIPFLNSLSLIVRCLVVCCENSLFQKTIKSIDIDDNFFFIPLLYKFVHGKSQQTKAQLPKSLRFLANSPFALDKSSSFWKTLGSNRVLKEEDYLVFLDFNLSAIIKSEVLFFKFKMNDCVFDFESFLKIQRDENIPFKFEEFVEMLDSVVDYRILLFLYYLETKCHENETLSIVVPDHFIPDTNIFLVSENSFVDQSLFSKLPILVPSLVIHELNCLANHPKNKNERPKLSALAKEVVDKLKPFITQDSNVKVLNNNSEIVTMNENLITSRDFKVKVDDQILDCINFFAKQRHKVKEFGEKTLKIQPFIFITNDNIFHLKIIASELISIDYKGLLKLAPYLMT